MRIIQLSVKLSEYIPHDAQLLSHVNLIATLWTVAHQGSSVHGIFQARVLEWGAIAFSGYKLKFPNIKNFSVFISLQNSQYPLSNISLYAIKSPLYNNPNNKTRYNYGKKI